MRTHELRTWEQLQVVNQHLQREVGRDLWNDARLSGSEFTVLAQLAAAGRNGVRPSDCARQIEWDSSRLAHQLRRLEKRGFISRAATESDGRGAVIELTSSGRTAYRRALGPHLASARRWFADALTIEQMNALAAVLDALLEHGARLRNEQEREK